MKFVPTVLASIIALVAASACAPDNTQGSNWGGSANIVDVRRKVPSRPVINSNVPRLGSRLGLDAYKGYGTAPMKIRGRVLPSVATPARPSSLPIGVPTAARVAPLRGLARPFP